MRFAFASLVLLVPAFAGADDNDLLARFKQENEQRHERVKAEVKAVLEKAQALEKNEPAQALELLQEVRDRLAQRGELTSRADQGLLEPLYERINTLRTVVRAQAAAELRAGLAEYRENLGRLHEQFALLKVGLVAPGKEPPPGEPVFIAYQNGKSAIGWLTEPPVYAVHCTINDQPTLLAPGHVSGLQTTSAFYIHDPATKRFVKLAPLEFFVTAAAAYPSARHLGFWLPRQEVEPPPGYDKRTLGIEGLILFSRTSAALMITWTRPNAHRPDLAAARSREPAVARLYRDVLVETKVPEVFTRLKAGDQERVRDAILAFLNQRHEGEPLGEDEIKRFSAQVAEVDPDYRADAVTFAYLLNRFYDRFQPGGQTLRRPRKGP